MHLNLMRSKELAERWILWLVNIYYGEQVRVCVAQDRSFFSDVFNVLATKRSQ